MGQLEHFWRCQGPLRNEFDLAEIYVKIGDIEFADLESDPVHVGSKMKEYGLRLMPTRKPQPGFPNWFDGYFVSVDSGDPKWVKVDLYDFLPETTTIEEAFGLFTSHPKRLFYFTLKGNVPRPTISLDT